MKYNTGVPETLAAIREAINNKEQEKARTMLASASNMVREALEETPKTRRELCRIYEDALDQIAEMLDDMNKAEAEETTETTAEETAETFDSFEAFQVAYFKAHPLSACHLSTMRRNLADTEKNIKEVRHAIHEIQENGASPNGWSVVSGVGPNGLPLYHADGCDKEAPEYLEELEARRADYSARLADKLAELRAEYESHKAEQTAETTEQPAEAPESTQSDRARSAYLNTCDECEAIEATGTREAMHEAKKLRTLAAEALAHFLRTRAPEWVEELETLQREAFDYSPDGLQDQRRGAEGIGYHPIE